MKLTILTPEKLIFEGEAISIQIPSEDGLMGILNHHAPILAACKPGAVSILKTDGTQIYCISHGFFEFNSNQGTLLVDSAEKPEDIDELRAKEAMKRAEERLKSREKIDFLRAERALHRSIARLKVKSSL